MQDHHWNKKIRIKHEDFVIFSSTDCQVLHYFHMHCGQQPHVGFHQQLQKVNFYMKIELSSNVSVTSMHINYTILYKWNMMRKNTKTKQNKTKKGEEHSVCTSAIWIPKCYLKLPNNHHKNNNRHKYNTFQIAISWPLACINWKKHMNMC